MPGPLTAAALDELGRTTRAMLAMSDPRQDDPEDVGRARAFAAAVADPGLVLALITAARERDEWRRAVAAEWHGADAPADVAAEAANYRGQIHRLAARVEELESLLTLRCGYILGACRGEEEMRAEARAMLRAVEGTPDGR